MNIGAILVGIGLLVLVGAYVGRPLFKKQSSEDAGGTPDNGSRAQLIARRDAVYALIRELDADYQTGKLNDHDYQVQRQRYVAQGVSLLQQLDALPGDNHQAALEADIEAAVLALRKTSPQPETASPEPADRFCTQCGHPAEPQDNFCRRCGAPLKKAA